MHLVDIENTNSSDKVGDPTTNSEKSIERYSGESEVVCDEAESDGDGEPEEAASGESKVLKAQLKNPAPYTSKRKQFRGLITEIKGIINKAVDSLISEAVKTGALQIIDEMEQKYKLAFAPKDFRSKRRSVHPKTEEDFGKVLKGTAENGHPWMPKNKYADGTLPELRPLVRAWDDKSKARITDERIGFLSGGSNWNEKGGLDTNSGRKAISRHGNWGDRIHTPFISVTTSYSEIFLDRIPHMDNRQVKGGTEPNTMVTLINPSVRLAAGHPLLRMKEEMVHHGVKSKYGETSKYDHSFYENEYLLLFCSPPEEIVCTWTVRAIKKQMEKEGWNEEQWWNNELMAKFNAHEKARKEGTIVKCENGCTCCGH